jgi:SAM-dependent methyltransferase
MMRGDTVFCPVCGRGAIAFLPMGTPPRPHVRCPFCGSMERTRMLWTLLERRGVLKTGAHVLHVAPEPGLRERLRAIKGIRYVAGDKHEPGYHYPLGTIDLDVTSLPFPDATFDVIICSHVLEHVPDDRRAMRELHRVLKPGGIGLLVVPFDPRRAATLEDPSVTDPTERLRLFGQHDHVRLYGADYSDRLKDAGFGVEIVDMTAGMDPAELFRLGFSPRELLHVVTR